MVEEGTGYALGLDRLINTSGNSHLTFVPLEPKIEVGLTFVWKKYQVLNKPSAFFLEQLKRELDNIKDES